MITSSSGLASAASNTSGVIPISKSDTVMGQNIPIGYQVGQSIIYPGNGGYSILANPEIHWTRASKLAYVNNHQAQADLNVFLNSAYAQSPEAQQARKPMLLKQSTHPSLQITNTVLQTSNAVNSSTSTPTGSFTFDSGQYFSVNGATQGGFVGDGSTLTTELGNANGTNLDWPYFYAAWTPYTEVMDLQGNPISVNLQMQWTFAGTSFEVSYPPGVYPSSSSFTWDSGNQPTWDYTFAEGQSFIWSSSTLATQTATTLFYAGTVNVSSGGTIQGYPGSHSEGYNIDGIWGNTVVQ